MTLMVYFCYFFKVTKHGNSHTKYHPYASQKIDDHLKVVVPVSRLNNKKHGRFFSVIQFPDFALLFSMRFFDKIDVFYALIQELNYF